MMGSARAVEAATDMAPKPLVPACTRSITHVIAASVARTALAFVLASIAVGAACAAPAPAPSSAPDADASDACGGPGYLLATLDRPAIGYSACAVPRGALLLESGYQNQSQAGASPSSATSLGQLFTRVGLAERFELDFIGPNFNRVSSDGPRAHGVSDLALGFKAQLPQRGRFTYAVDGLVSAATGTGGFSAGGPAETLNVDVSYGASPAVGLSATLAGSSAAGSFTLADAASKSGPVVTNAERFGSLQPSLTVTAQIPHYYQFYVELVGQTKLGPHQGGRLFSDAGLVKLLGRSVAVDAEYAMSFTPIAGSRFHYVGVGAAVRVR